MTGLPKPTRFSDSSESKFKKPVYLKLTEGDHFIRFLHSIDETKMVYTHWVKRMSIECIGEDCPICVTSKEILNSVGGDIEVAKQTPGFIPYQVRYYTNVLDRTQVKIHPESATAYENKRRSDGTFPQTCGETGKLLEGVTPTISNKVKILAGGTVLFNQLNSVDSTTGVRDEFGNIVPMGIKNFDIVLVVNGTGRERKTTPVPQANMNDVIEVDSEELYDLDTAIITLTASEVYDLLRDVSLKDIFAARRAVEGDQVVHNTVGDVYEDDFSTLKADVESVVNDLLD